MEPRGWRKQRRLMVGEILAFGSLMGLGATATMDLLGKGVRRWGLTAGVDSRWIGRWLLWILRGRFLHSDITVASEQRHERRAAFLAHYAIGIVLAAVYLLGIRWFAISPSALFVALGYGFATNVFAWFLMFPAMGFGILGLRAPRDRKLFLTSLVNHLFYGLGLWWTGALLPVG